MIIRSWSDSRGRDDCHLIHPFPAPPAKRKWDYFQTLDYLGWDRRRPPMVILLQPSSSPAAPKTLLVLHRLQQPSLATPSTRPSTFLLTPYSTPPSQRPYSQPSELWTACRLNIQPIVSLQRSAVGSPSPPPFPRYGYSLSPISTAAGELFLFGGLAKEQVRNEL